MSPSSPAPTVVRRLARAFAAVLFVFAIFSGSLSSGRSNAEAKSRNTRRPRARASVAGKQARAKNDATRRADSEDARRGARDADASVGPVALPTDGEEFGEEGNVQKREEWFYSQRAFPFNDIPDEARRQAWESRPKSKLKSSDLRGALSSDALQWTPLGPSPAASFFSNWGRTSGHVRAIAVKPDDGNVVLIGGASGGIWRSTDAGQTFTPVSDSQVDLAVGAIAFAPSNPSIVYAGMGAQSGFGSYLGTGVLKSTDAGATWSRVDTSGLTTRGRSVSMAVDPTDPNRVYLCHFLKQVTDASSTTNSDGLYVSTDGGSTWTRTFAGLPEVVLVSPADPNVVFMATGRDDTTAAHLAGVYKSTDRGLTWTNSYSIGVVTSPSLKDCYIAVTAADPQRVYVVSIGASASTLRLAYSTDNGATWTTQPDTATVDMGQWGYNSYVYASPSNPDVIFLGTRDVWKSTNKGATWGNITGNFTSGGGYQPNFAFTHPDQHSFAFAPGDGSTYYIGNDGGLWKTTTGGSGVAPYTSLNSSLTLQQFVGIAAHPTAAGVTYGGTQDNGSQVRSQDANDWKEFATGDGGRVVVVPSDPTLVFPSYVSGTIWRYKNNGGGSFSFQAQIGDSSVFKDSTTGTADRVPFYPPIVTNGADSTLYVGTYRLWVSTNLGTSWTTPGGATDLSFAPTVDCTATPKPAKCSDMLSAIGVSRSNTQVIYTGSAQGRLMVSQDGGANWTEVTGSIAPSGTATRFISSITVDPSNPAVAYITLSGFGTGHVWKTTNMGQTWADLSGTNAATKLPNIPASALLLDPAGAGLIYVGTDIGVFRSSGDGNWEALTNGLPPVPVSSFTVTASGKIQVGTFGRGIFELNNTAAPPSVQFSAASVQANEGDGRATITVTRTGDTSGTSTVDVRTNDDTRAIRCDDTTSAPGVAFARCDYATVAQTLTFAPGVASATFSVPIIDDSFVEPDENVRLALSNPLNASLGAQSTTLLVIHDNDTPGRANPIDAPDFFVRMQYIDFLSREPDGAGLSSWVSTLNGCAAGDTACDRVSVSANFFRSTEFQLKGLFVFKFYKVSFGRLPLYSEIVADMSSVTGASDADLIAKKAAFTSAWAQRTEFTNTFGSASNQSFIDALMNRYGLQSITTINPASPDDAQAQRVTLTRADLVNRLTAGTLTRGQVVRALADSNEVSAAEFNPAFVAMQYFGYLRRDPDAQGYSDWLRTINASPSDVRSMVNGFVNSTEYRLRFGQP